MANTLIRAIAFSSLLVPSIIGTPPLPQAQAASQPFAYEITTRDRWLYGNRDQVHTPNRLDTAWVFLDSLRVNQGANSISLWSQIRYANTSDPASVRANLDGTAQLALGSYRPVPAPRVTLFPRDTAITTAARIAPGGRMSLPATRMWDLIPAFHPARIEPGAAYADTISYQTSEGEYRQQIDGRRVSRILRDTVIAGSTMWIVGDSANVTYAEVYLEQERTMASMVRIERRVSGVIRGNYIYDPGLRLHRRRVDTAALNGTATLFYPDGRRLTSPVRLERAREWRQHNPTTYAERQLQIRAEQNARPFSVVRVPLGPLEERLASGNAQVRDSLLQRFLATRDADERSSIQQLLSRFMFNYPAFQAVFDSARLASGDSVFRWQQLTRSVYPGAPLTASDVRAILPFMENPERAFRLNVSRDVAYENIVYRMQHYGPITQPQTAARHYTQEALELLAAQYDRNLDPRLRHVALHVRASMNPAWADTALREFRTGRAPLLASAVDIITGIGNTNPAARQLPLPETGADWTAWRDWVGAANPDAPGIVSSRPLWLERPGNSGAIRYRERATGRDITGELQRNFASATNDTAKAIFGQILNGLGALVSSLDETALVLREGTPMMRTLAIQSLARFRADGIGNFSSTPLESALADSIVDQMLEARYAGRDAWTTLDAKRGVATAPARPSQMAPAGAKLYLNAAGISAQLREKWSSRVTIVTDAEWAALNVREAAELVTVQAPVRAGPFMRLGFMIDGRAARSPSQPPSAGASSTAYLLMNFDGEWVIVTKTQAAA